MKFLYRIPINLQYFAIFIVCLFLCPQESLASTGLRNNNSLKSNKIYRGAKPSTDYHITLAKVSSKVRDVKEGNALYNEEDYSQARDKYNEALSKDSGSSIIHFNIGSIVPGVGKFKTFWAEARRGGIIRDVQKVKMTKNEITLNPKPRRFSIKEIIEYSRLNKRLY